VHDLITCVTNEFVLLVLDLNSCKSILFCDLALVKHNERRLVPVENMTTRSLGLKTHCICIDQIGAVAGD
jgi:hypothetical protein